jgi:cobalt-zinc-cadmium efflux system membrane fusion protein
VVPSDAVQSDGREHLVFVRLAPAVFQARAVRRGLSDDTVTEVLGDVRPGDEVATIGSFTLKSELLRERILGEE